MDVEVCTCEIQAVFANTHTARIFCVLPRSDIFNIPTHGALSVKTL